MGATAIRLVVAEIGSERQVRIIEEASRGVLLGRDTFSAGTIRAQTADAALASLQGFRRLIDGYAVHQIRAVATSAVREARNGDIFLDRIRGRTGIAFEIINEAEESRLMYLAVRKALGDASALGARTLLAEVGGGSTSLTLLRNGQLNRSGVYALGAVRLRQRERSRFVQTGQSRAFWRTSNGPTSENPPDSAALGRTNRERSRGSSSISDGTVPTSRSHFSGGRSQT